jgi:hypothetical protein
MRTIALFGMAFCLTAALGFSVTMYRGQLMDAGCYNHNSSAGGEKVWVKCAPSGTTTHFAIHTNGKIRMLDAGGNDKALTAYRSGILKRDKNGDMPVRIDGYRHGNTIKVEGLRASGSDTSIH